MRQRLFRSGAREGGGPWAISGYLGKQDDFDEAMGRFVLASLIRRRKITTCSKARSVPEPSRC